MMLCPILSTGICRGSVSPEQKRAPSAVLAVTASQSLGLVAPVAAGLADRGWDVTVVSSPEATRRPKAVPGVSYVGVPMNREPSPLSDAVSLVSWIRLLIKKSPDVVMAGTPKASLVGLLAGKMTRVPVRIYHLRGLRLETVAHGPKRGVLAAIERMTSDAATSVLSVSDSLAKSFRDMGLAGTRTVDVLGSGSSKGVDLSQFDATDAGAEDVLRVSWGLRDDLPIVGFIGRVSRDKGLDDLLVASDSLMQAGVSHQLLVLGSREDQTLADELHAASSQDRPVLLPGSVDDIPSALQAIDVLCLPTRREGFPNVVLEAAAASVPTVTTNATGAVDSVVDGSTGYTVDVGDADAMAIALGRLLTDERLRRQMGHAARDRVEAEFEQSKVVAAVCDYVENQARTARRRLKGN